MNRHRAGGLTIVESAISVVIVGVMLVAALNTIGASAMGRSKMNDRARGQLLAGHLISEILQANYEEPDDPPIFGVEIGEVGGNRNTFDDVDDYNGWSSIPPKTLDQTEIPDLAGWKRSVVVEYVDPSDLNLVQGTDLGVKRITVTVTKDQVEVASIMAVRTDGLEAALGRPMDPIVIE